MFFGASFVISNRRQTTRRTTESGKPFCRGLFLQMVKRRDFNLLAMNGTRWLQASVCKVVSFANRLMDWPRRIKNGRYCLLLPKNIKPASLALKRWHRQPTDRERLHTHIHTHARYCVTVQWIRLKKIFKPKMTHTIGIQRPPLLFDLMDVIRVYR